MKKKLVYALAICGILAIFGGIYAYAPAPPDLSSLAAPNGSYSKGTFPHWYTPTDTFITTGTDTFKMAMHRGYVTSYNTNDVNSIMYDLNFYKVGGSPTVTVALYGSANNGISYGSAIQTYTVSPTALYSATVTNQGALTTNYLVNSPSGGMPYTDLMWVSTGSAASTCAWQSGITVR